MCIQTPLPLINPIQRTGALVFRLRFGETTRDSIGKMTQYLRDIEAVS